VRAGDTAARFGGDEFIIVADRVDDVELEQLVRRLRNAIDRPIDVDGTMVTISMSVGHVTIPADGSATADALIDAADAAMYRAKG